MGGSIFFSIRVGDLISPKRCLPVEVRMHAMAVTRLHICDVVESASVVKTRLRKRRLMVVHDQGSSDFDDFDDFHTRLLHADHLRMEVCPIYFSIDSALPIQ